MKLLGTPASPYVRKVRILIEEKKLPYEYVQDRPSAPGSQVPNFNPLGKIPVLVRDDGGAVYDSPVIAEYVDGLATPRLIPESFAERIEVRRWEALADGMMDCTVSISHDFRNPPEKQQNADWHAKQQGKIDRALATMEKDLGSRGFCHGDAFSYADIAVGTALGYLDSALPKVDWRKGHPGLRALTERLGQREAFRKTVAAS